MRCVSINNPSYMNGLKQNKNILITLDKDTVSITIYNRSSAIKYPDSALALKEYNKAIKNVWIRTQSKRLY